MNKRIPHSVYLRIRGKIIAALKEQQDYTTSADHLFELLKHELRTYEVLERLNMNGEVICRGRQFFDGRQGPRLYKLAEQFRVNNVRQSVSGS